MRKMTIAAAAWGLAVLAQPALAEPVKITKAEVNKEPSEAEISAFMKDMFKVEPLTAEQRARLPQAQAVIARMMPPGTLQQMMGGMFDKMLTPLMAMGSKVDSATVAEELSIEDEDFAMSDEDAKRVGAILDPAREERAKLVTDVTQHSMSAAMTAMEPGMRKGMAEAYAATFTTGELTAIDAFFTTPEGAAFARKSYALASDPRIMAAAMEGMPAMLGQMKTMADEMKAAEAKLPARRSYAELSAAERAEIARLTGLKQDAIREGLAKAAAEREKKAADQP